MPSSSRPLRSVPNAVVKASSRTSSNDGWLVCANVSERSARRVDWAWMKGVGKVVEGLKDEERRRWVSWLAVWGRRWVDSLYRETLYYFE